MWSQKIEKMRLPQLGFFSGRARHFSQTGSNRPRLTRAENGDRRGSAPLCAGLAGNHGVSFTANSSLKVANAWSVASMDARGVRARMAPSSRDAGVAPPFPTRALPTLRGPRAPFSRCDRIFCASAECVGTVLPSRWCAAAEGRQFLTPGQTPGC